MPVKGTSHWQENNASPSKSYLPLSITCPVVVLASVMSLSWSLLPDSMSKMCCGKEVSVGSTVNPVGQEFGAWLPPWHFHLGKLCSWIQTYTSLFTHQTQYFTPQLTFTFFHWLNNSWNNSFDGTSKVEYLPVINLAYLSAECYHRDASDI